MESCPPPLWTSPEGLLRLWDELLERKMTKGSRLPPTGVDGLHAAAFDARKQFHCREMSRILQRNGAEAETETAYRFAPLVEHRIETEPGKQRRIYVPRIRDQVVLKGVFSDLELAMKRAGLVGHLPDPQAVARGVIADRLQGRCHVARLDIRGFYDSVDFEILSQCLDGLALPRFSRGLLDQLVQETPHRPRRGTREDSLGRTQGLPTGTSVSTLLAELYLHPLDSIAGSLPGMGYHRFVDDVILLSADSEALRAGVQALTEAAHAVRLELHGNKSFFSSFAVGFDFLGFHYSGDQVAVSPERIEKWLDQFEKLRNRCISEWTLAGDGRDPGQLLETLVSRFNQKISGLTSRHIPYYTIANDLEVYKEVDQKLRRMVAGTARKAGRELQLASVHAWAWRYKKDPVGARQLARERYGPSTEGASLVR